MPAATTADIRAWAQANGYVVGDRGRLPAEVSEAFAAANPGPKRHAPSQATPTRKATPTRAIAAPASSSTADGQSGPRTQGAAESAGDTTTNAEEMLGRISTLEQQVTQLTVRLDAADPSRRASTRRRKFGRSS